MTVRKPSRIWLFFFTVCGYEDMLLIVLICAAFSRVEPSNTNDWKKEFSRGLRSFRILYQRPTWVNFFVTWLDARLKIIFDKPKQNIILQKIERKNMLCSIVNLFILFARSFFFTKWIRPISKRFNDSYFSILCLTVRPLNKQQQRDS